MAPGASRVFTAVGVGFEPKPNRVGVILGNEPWLAQASQHGPSEAISGQEAMLHSMPPSSRPDPGHRHGSGTGHHPDDSRTGHHLDDSRSSGTHRQRRQIP
jgi:hypothetical protein